MKKKSDALTKKERFVALIDLYGSLLNESELKRIKDHYDNDYSLAELAQMEGISRNAIYLSIASAEHKLEEYEHKLHLLSHRVEVKSLLDKLQVHKENEEAIQKIKEIIENGI